MSDPKNDLPHRTSAPQWRKQGRLDGKPRSQPRGRHAKSRTDNVEDAAPREVDQAVPVHQRLGFRPAEFAALIGVSYVTVWRAIKAGKIDTVDQNGMKIIPRAYAVKVGYITDDNEPPQRAATSTT